MKILNSLCSDFINYCSPFKIRVLTIIITNLGKVHLINSFSSDLKLQSEVNMFDPQVNSTPCLYFVDISFLTSVFSFVHIAILFSKIQCWNRVFIVLDSVVRKWLFDYFQQMFNICHKSCIIILYRLDKVCPCRKRLK